jgi:hypothetical protein
MNSWTVIKGVSDTLYPLVRTNHVLASITTGLLGISLYATLIRARLPTIQTEQPNPAPAKRSFAADMTAAAISAVSIIYSTSSSYSLELSLHRTCAYLSAVAGAIAHLQPGMTTPYDTALDNWTDIKAFAEYLPEHIAQLQHTCMWMGIATAIAFAVTVGVICFWQAQQPEQHSTAKTQLDVIVVGSLGLATVASIVAYVYAKADYPQLV